MDRSNSTPPTGATSRSRPPRGAFLIPRPLAVVDYFLALLTESLLERELRRAMDREAIASLPLYPEGRKCRRPTARRVIDLFEDVQRHSLRVGRRPPMVFTTELSRLQRRLLRLLGMTNVYDA